MLFKIENPENVMKLIELFKVFKGLNNFCTFCCKPTGIFIQTMDDSHVSLLDINIDKGWFDHYESEDEMITFNTKIVSTILSLYSPDAVITFTSADDHLEIDIDYKDRTVKSFQIPLIDMDSDIMESQEIEHSLDFSINAKNMDRYMNDMQIFGDSLELIYCDDVIYMRSEGDEGKYCLKLTVDLVDDLVVEDELQLRCKIPLRHASVITKMSSVFDSVSISMSEGAPCTFKLGDEKFDVKFYVAPKVEDDDEFDFSEFDKNDDDELTNEVVG